MAHWARAWKHALHGGQGSMANHRRPERHFCLITPKVVIEGSDTSLCASPSSFVISSDGMAARH